MSTSTENSTENPAKKTAKNSPKNLTTESTAGTNTQDSPHTPPGGFLGTIEKIGNKLPNPFWLFVILAGLVAVTSWIGAHIGMTATDPQSGETIAVENLLTAEGLSKMVTEAVANFTSFPPLGVILAVMLGVAVAEQSGLLSALVRAMVAKVSPKMLTFVVALTGVTGSVASDAIYVILIPLGAMAFHAVGRSPIVGAMVAFAASSAGFNASLILNITDLLLGGISTSAAQIVDEAYEVSPLANIFFVIPSAVVLSLIITVVTEFFIVRKARELVDHDDLDTSELDFSAHAPAQSADGQSADAQSADAPAAEGQDALSLAPAEAYGLMWSGVALLVFLAAFFALIFIPGSPFASPDGEFMNSPLIRSIAIPISLAFFLVGAVYGLVVGTIKEAGDFPEFMAKGLQTLVPMIVLFFMVAQFLAWFSWSNLGVWTAIKGSELLQAWDLPPVLMFEPPQVLFRLSRWENLEHAKEV
ncbi:AbgT family transporter [Corynebacterium lizhenjunii]|uniref:AbgT family transporter n=1 Tax=Corynebacterium lizhenjunii TaxID=2709394 RepID=UPI0013EB81A3